jgi:type 2A phosphatase activator TIP41
MQSFSQQIDRSLLMERDPILFFDEVILYESDLDDNGGENDIVGHRTYHDE